jgi:transcriptional regulator of arginine metabolism
MNKYSSGPALRRREAILAVARDGRPRSQEELQQRLSARGIVVAQPTLSRDLRALGFAKTPTGYVAAAGPAAQDRPPPAPAPARADGGAGGGTPADRALRDFALSVRAAGSLVVVRTPPAAAPTVARALDEAALPGVVGSIAGDDTIFLATEGPLVARRIERRLQGPLGPRRRARPAGG